MGSGSSHEEFNEVKELLGEIYGHLKLFRESGLYAMIEIALGAFNNLKKRIEKILKSSSSPKMDKWPIAMKNGERGTDLSAQILTSSDSTATHKFVENLQKRLENSYGIWTSLTTSLKKDEHIGFNIIVCNSSSTAETIVSNFKDEELAGSTIVIMMHVIRESKLSGSLQHHNKEMHIERFGRNIRIVEMGYTQDAGIYNCSTNEQAFTEIQTFAKDNVPSKSSLIPALAWKPEKKFKHAKHSAENVGESTNRKEDSLGSEKAVFDIMIPDCSSSEAASAFVDELKNNHGIILHKVNDASENQSDRNLILLCNETSRLEANINECLYAIKSKELNKRTILLILHVSEKKPSTENTKAALSDKNYKEYLAIIDIAFTRYKGIFDCEMNTNALKELASYGTIKITSEAKTTRQTGHRVKTELEDEVD